LIFPTVRASVLAVTATTTIDPAITMGELLHDFPGAQRALFRAYHIGGCSHCGFRPEETLTDVCQRNDNIPVEEVAATILAAHEAELKMQIRPTELAAKVQAGEPIEVVDVRSREEWDAVRLPNAKFLTQELMQEMMTSWPKEKEIVFVCHHGVRSLDAAAYFAGHGFTQAKSLTGGIDRWSVEVDPSLPRYELE
jgi:rhodanese-related sulfurtransferase